MQEAGITRKGDAGVATTKCSCCTGGGGEQARVAAVAPDHGSGIAMEQRAWLI